MADEADIDPSRFSKLRSGAIKETPTPAELAGLSDALGLSQYGMLRAIGYEVGPPVEDPTPQDTELMRRIRSVTDQWTPRQREIVWKLIENANAMREPDQAAS